jgi:hypothetical protein
VLAFLAALGEERVGAGALPGPGAAKGLLLAVWMGAFAGAALGLWELDFGDR